MGGGGAGVLELDFPRLVIHTKLANYFVPKHSDVALICAKDILGRNDMMRSKILYHSKGHDFFTSQSAIGMMTYIRGCLYIMRDGGGRVVFLIYYYITWWGPPQLIKILLRGRIPDLCQFWYTTTCKSMCINLRQNSLNMPNWPN